MLDRPSVVRLRAGLAQLTEGLAAGNPSNDDELRERVCAAVADLRDLGWPPERVIVAVKQLAADVGLRPSRNLMAISGHLTPHDEIVEEPKGARPARVPPLLPTSRFSILLLGVGSPTM